MKIALKDVLKGIETANDFEINEIMAAVRKRFALVFPDWEVIYLSCPKYDPQQRKEALKIVTDYFSPKK